MPTIPENAKLPQDHKPAKTALKPADEVTDMSEATEVEADLELPVATQTKGGFHVSYNGFEADVVAEALNDFELLDDLAELDNGGAGASLRMPSVLRRMFGPENFKGIMDALRNPETGKVPVEVGEAFLMAVFQGLNPTSAS